LPKIAFTTTAPVQQKADLLLLPFFKGPEAGPGVREAGKALGQDLVRLLERQGAKGGVGDAVAIPTFGKLAADTLLLVGLGPKADVKPDTVRRASGKVARRLDRHARVASALAQGVRRDVEVAVQAHVEGLLLGGYRFDRYKTDGDGADRPKLRTITVLGAERWNARGVREAVRRAEILAEAESWARDLVNTPSLDATPDFLSREARRMAREVGLRVKVLGKPELERGGFGGILGVGSGSANPPRLIELVHDGGSGPPIALSGKGITFDSGGLSLKDPGNMEWMKADMAGAASVLGAMRAIGRLKPKVNVVAAIPCAENMPGGSAIRPGDILRHRGGKTSEVLNTDAEGRLVLADALAYLTERKPSVIVDTATLTGACMIALGEDLWGVMGSDDGLVKELLAAGEEVGQPGWQLPLWEPYREKIRSDVADVKNIGDRWGGAITAALFLKEFVGDVPWAHMDIAGSAFAKKTGDYWSKGATGSPVRALVRFVERRAGA
jgi:leucyl aminopeptidase